MVKSYLYCKSLFILDKKQILTSYTLHTELTSLSDADRMLLEKAAQVCDKAYSPYSAFPVGAALIDEQGEVFAATNQENVSFPAGTCAERSLINFYNSNYPDRIINTLAIVATENTSLDPFTPCGFCRQVLSEMEYNQTEPIRLIVQQASGDVWEFESMGVLLPLAFGSAQLRR